MLGKLWNKGQTLKYLRQHMYDGCCYPWPYARDRDGYSIAYSEKRQQTAARIVLALDGRPKPFDKAQVRHLCGKGMFGCFNATCLVWGTKSENECDKMQHGTHNKGERHGYSKLTDAQVVLIKDALNHGVHGAELARRFGVNHSTIYDIEKNRTWKHI